MYEISLQLVSMLCLCPVGVVTKAKSLWVTEVNVFNAGAKCCKNFCASVLMLA